MQLSPRGLAVSELAIEVFRANGALLAAGDALARPAGLTSARWQVLGVIDHAPATVADIARTMGLRRQSVQQTADALTADGLAAFTENPRHRRAKLLAPTEAGHRALAEVERAHADWADALAASLAPSQIEAATAALRALTTALEPEGSR
ncbi:MarR family winged helix-turn-helix transcriptional regulator [Glycomyces algeriensis]|uniref:MarR family transcriptional regulator n=1 Tax=Glycomyces algeriensis TaxID=256037 RepID=A0A9W6GAQ7_9ACTN|nr:MarR family transcriptional regulator [Glycomyces algeriensis]MDA1368369.1 MarR family transcriptional regulator [Glycomyces algeriensis]MDR7351812.1 DNA-binding MarR family transcriptional regulator [Glycomyces algeriensis]GLI44539.1 MarR family transcriptional regulator [Glycomyces algeriensis]